MCYVCVRLCSRCLFHCAHAQGDFSRNLKKKRHDARLKIARFLVRLDVLKEMGEKGVKKRMVGRTMKGIRKQYGGERKVKKLRNFR